MWAQSVNQKKSREKSVDFGVWQVIHLDTADKSEFRKLQQLKIETGELSTQV